MIWSFSSKLEKLEPSHTRKFPRVNAQNSKLGPIQPWDVKDFLRPDRGREAICERSAGKPDRNRSAGYALLQSQEPLPPYELDPMFDNPVIRKRIGELIANAMKHRSSRP
jgi:hypothetical protein